MKSTYVKPEIQIVDIAGDILMLITSSEGKDSDGNNTETPPPGGAGNGDDY